MALELTAEQEASEAFDAGANAGYSHVNYALAYGTGEESLITTTIPNRFRSYEERQAYLNGWHEGRRQAADDHGVRV